MKAAIHPIYNEIRVLCACGNNFTTRSTHKGDIHGRNLFGLPSIFHRQAEAGGHRRTRRALPPQVRQGGTGEEVTHAVDQTRFRPSLRRGLSVGQPSDQHPENFLEPVGGLVRVLDHIRAPTDSECRGSSGQARISRRASGLFATDDRWSCPALLAYAATVFRNEVVAFVGDMGLSRFDG